MNDIKKFVVGFMFSEDMNNVALIKKNRPYWEPGMLNAPGGMVDKDDLDELAAMARLFKEEFDVPYLDWNKFVVTKNPSEEVSYFYGRCNLRLLDNMSNEKVIIIPTKNLNNHYLPHAFPWLIPMAMDKHYMGRLEVCECKYTN